MRPLILSLAVLIASASLSAEAANLNVAVAANFTKPAEAIAAAFTAKTGTEVDLSFGATGALYAQISQGAPFEILLAADTKRPALAVTEGFGIADTVFTYAIGTLVLYSPAIDITDGEAALRAGGFQHLAIADPKTAPYGAAGIETLDKLGLKEAVANLMVTGENISQTLQFIDTGNAELGFLALSQVVGKPATQVWRVPKELYAPILQDAVLLRAGADDPVAQAFLTFLKGPESRAIIEKFGYTVP